ncbi:MAG: hypothetical protein NBKEAIPA_03142 [Nitrospirae bacterium]|nr:hypothetical protein [Nitrospirota bacterium]
MCLVQHRAQFAGILPGQVLSVPAVRSGIAIGHREQHHAVECDVGPVFGFGDGNRVEVRERRVGNLCQAISNCVGAILWREGSDFLMERE